MPPIFIIMLYNDQLRDMPKALMEKIDRIEELLEINAKIDNFMGF